jgi:hypothetical protein
MPTLRDLMILAKTIDISPSGPLVEHTIASEVRTRFAGRATIRRTTGLTASAGSIRIASLANQPFVGGMRPELPKEERWMMVRVRLGEGIEILASHEQYLYGVWSRASEDWAGLDVREFTIGKFITPTFPHVRPVYDIFLTQVARTVRDFDRDEHFRTLARMGATYAEVNGLAFAVPFETGPKGELLHRFYTYCPALDQFVSSRLNKGFYDDDYLQANLNNLKANADLAEKYGLTPGLVCFEPRSVPDALLDRYPVLRGARVDHPMRSFRPRYNLSVAHPVVREHYAELMENLVREVPRLGYISIWSNDSGAGFEYTHSLYVGRNGGGYVVREWLGAKDIAAAAAMNLVRFLRVLRDAGRKVNPAFRTLIRLEPFWEEHDHIWKQLEDGLDVEVSSLLTKGWKLAYKHPRYEEVPEIHGTALYSTFVENEKDVLQDLRTKGADADVYFVPGILGNHEPLIGIPFPRLVHQKLLDMADRGVTTAAFQGGVTPQSFAPYNINQEVIRAFQFDRNLDIQSFLTQKAEEWIGSDLAGDLVEVWRLSEEVFKSFPIPVWIFSGWGVWYRLFVRPIIPNIEAIPEKDRRYYENFLLATTHNRTRVDFRYDVGFDLCEPARAELAVRHMDQDLFPLLDQLMAKVQAMQQRAKDDRSRACVEDLSDRMRALCCWYRNQRNITAWIAGVHGYLETTDEDKRRKYRAMLKQMVLDEIHNTGDLLRLWETARTRWMIASEVGETTFIYFHKNFADLLRRKIELMTGREDDVPYVDPDYQWRVPGYPEERR